MRKSDLHSSGINLAIKLLGAVCGLVAMILLARFLGPAGFGEYSYLVALVGLLAVPAQVGLPNLVIREIGKVIHKGAGTEAGRIWHWANRLVGKMALVLLGVMVGALTVLPHPDIGWGTALLSLPLIPLVALSSIRSAALRGIGRVNLAQVPELLARPASLLVLVAGFVLFADLPLSAELAMGFNLAATFIAFALGATWLRRHLPATESGGADLAPGTRNAWIRASIVLGVATSLQMLNSNIDVLMLGALREAADVGIYRSASNVTSYLLFGIMSVTVVIMPQVIPLLEEEDRENLRRLLRRASGLMLGVTVIGALAILVLGRFIFGTLFGPDFLPAYTAALCLSLGPLVIAFAGPVSMLLNMSGEETWTAVSSALSLAINVVANLVLIPRFGMIGAAIATVVSTVVWNAAMYFVVWRRIGVRAGVV